MTGPTEPLIDQRRGLNDLCGSVRSEIAPCFIAPWWRIRRQRNLGRRWLFGRGRSGSGGRLGRGRGSRNRRNRRQRCRFRKRLCQDRAHLIAREVAGQPGDGAQAGGVLGGRGDDAGNGRPSFVRSDIAIRSPSSATIKARSGASAGVLNGAIVRACSSVPIARRISAASASSVGGASTTTSSGPSAARADRPKSASARTTKMPGPIHGPCPGLLMPSCRRKASLRSIFRSESLTGGCTGAREWS